MIKIAQHAWQIAWPFPLALALTLPISVIAFRGLAPLAATLGVLALTIEIRRGLRAPHVDLRSVVPFAAFLIWAGLSLTWSHDPGVSVDRFASLAANFLVAWLVIGTAHRQIGSEVKLRSTAFAYLVGILLALILMLLHTLTGGALYEALGLTQPIADRALALAATNPAATVVAVVSLPGCLLLWRGIGASFALVILFASAIAVFLSQSLAAAIGLITAIAVTLAVWYGGRKMLTCLAAGMIMVVLLFPALRLASDTPFTDLREELASRGLTLPPSTTHRTYIYDFVLQRIVDQPVVGWGLGVSRHLPGGQEGIAELNDRELLPLHPHNAILEIWVELGALGALGLAAVIWKIMAAIKRRISDRGAVAVFAGAASGYMVIGLTAYSVWSSWWMAAGVLVAGLATAILADRNLTEQAAPCRQD